MQKTASKNIIFSESYELLKTFLQLNYYTHTNFNALFLIEYKRYIHLDTMHVRNL